jgi:hypothetical protein
MARTGADIKTTRADIIAYWSKKIYEGDLGCDWSEAHERCWRCGTTHKEKSLQRCHIVPSQAPFDGPDSPENLVLLCARCHAEAPSCSDPKEIWAWIKTTRAQQYDTYWTQREWEDIKRIYGLDIENELKLRIEDYALIMTTYQEIFDREIGIHFNTVSIASKFYLWRKVLQKIPPNPSTMD